MDNQELNLEELGKEIQEAVNDSLSAEEVAKIRSAADNVTDHTETAEEKAAAAQKAAAEKAAAEKAAAEQAAALKAAAEESERKEAQRRAAAEKAQAERARAIEEAQERKKRKKRRKTAKRAAITLILLLVLAAIGTGAYLYMANYYGSHFFSGTTINGKDVSGMTAAEVKRDLLGITDTYKLEIIERDGVVEELNAGALGRSYVDNNLVEQALASQDNMRWLFHLGKAEDYTVEFESTYDERTAQASIEKLHCVSGSGIIAPVDAALEKDANGRYYITPEVEGNKVNETKLRELLISAVDQQLSSINLEEEDVYEKPQIYSDNKELNDRMNSLNKYLSVDVVYNFGPNKEVINGNTIADYIEDDGKNVTISTDFVDELVHEWGIKYDTFGLTRNFTTHDGVTIQIPRGGDYGWCLNKTKTAEDVKEAILSGATGEREPVWLYQALSWENGDLGGTYVEVSIPEQHLWCFKDGQLYVETDVITGYYYDEARRTHTGCFALNGKKRDTYLGEYNVQGYHAHVDFWMPFYDDQGLHDAYWYDSFGGSVYLSGGSHGCVSLPHDAMEQVFKVMDVGYPVVIYEDKTPVQISSSQAATAASALSIPTQAEAAAMAEEEEYYDEDDEDY